MNGKPPTDLELLRKATTLLARAHSPYSGITVAAAALSDDGRVFEGVNVENTSLGLTVCAERNALASAVTQGAAGDGAPERRIVALVFTSNHDAVQVPCGACRQVIAELAPDARILFGRDGRILREWAGISALLPEAFDATWKKDAGS